MRVGCCNSPIADHYLLAMLPQLLLIVTLLLSVDCDAPPNQKESLIALYNNTAGPFWYVQTNWNFSTDPCTSRWFGVYCNLLNSTVTSISLDSNNLTGVLPDLQLPQLAVL